MRKFNISEDEQRNLFINYYNNVNERFHMEVPVFCRSVDLVRQSLVDHTITAIEFKLNNWKRAVEQALSVALSFDYLAICIPMPKTQKCKGQIINYCTQIGIGVYFFDLMSKDFEHAVVEKRVPSIWDVQRMQVIKYLEVR